MVRCNSRSVVELDDAGAVIGRWASVSVCSRETGISGGALLYQCKEHGRMRCGRVFRFEDDMVDEEPVPVMDDPDYPCVTCRHFSGTAAHPGRRSSGFCLRRHRHVKANDTCGEHDYPKGGKFVI